MYYDQKILIAKSANEPVYLYPKMANRHGMIAGATGTGKTITLKVLAESFSDCGVPVFFADVKGDLAASCKPGEMSEKIQGRVDALGLAENGFNFHACPVNFWDIYGEKGMPLRTTISEMGPLLLARILGLNETQKDLLTITFKIADDEQLLLLDTKDLKAMLQYVGENFKEYSLKYGNITKQSVAAIVRSIVALEAEGADKFFGEPALSIPEWLCTDCNGKGVIQILDCQKLILNPTMYSTFLLWMLSELFEMLPEVGDPEKPKMVFFFDEAHMLFDNASKDLLAKIEQVVKLIRSKGVGIFFITQSPKDIPDGVLSQLGNKIQHALHAYTPNEQKAAKAAAQSFRENPAFDTYDTMINLATGEALISVLDEKGVPTMVQKATVLPPQSRMGSLDDAERQSLIMGNMLYTRYSATYDRESAYELLTERIETQAEALRTAAEEAAAAKQQAKDDAAAAKAAEKAELAKKAQTKRAVKSVANSAGGTIGREIGNALGSSVGGKFGKKLGGNVGASIGRGIIGTLFNR